MAGKSGTAASLSSGTHDASGIRSKPPGERLRAFSRPGHRRRADRGAAGAAFAVGQPEASDEPVARAGGGGDQRRFETGQMELGPPEHGVPAAGRVVAPGQIDEALATLAVDVGAAEVEAALVDGQDVDVELEGRLGGVARREVDRIVAALHTDVDVLVLAEDPPGQVRAFDADAQGLLPGRGGHVHPGTVSRVRTSSSMSA